MPTTVTRRSDRGSLSSLDRVRTRLDHLFSHRLTDLTIGILILVSVTLTLAELSMTESARFLPAVERTNLAISLLFAVELTLRFVAESGRHRFVRGYFRRWWLDLLAVFPALILDGFALFRGLRTLRYLRLFRMGRLFSGVRNVLPYVVRKGAINLVLLSVTLFLAVAVGTALVLSFERQSSQELDSFGDAFWFSLYSLFAGEPVVPSAPSTTGGRIASVALIFMGLLVFAAFIGTVSALMVERLQREDDGMRQIDDLENHVILCGMGQVGYRTLQVLRRLDQKVVVIERDENSEFVDLARAAKVPVIVDDVRKAAVLAAAGLQRARAVIAATNDDLTNLEIALDARHDRPDVRVVMRFFDPRLAEKVAEGFDIQVALSSSALAAPAFAAAAVDRSVRGSLEVGDRVYIHSEFEVPAESSLAGRTVSEIRDDYEVHTLMYRDRDGETHWAPRFDLPLPGGATVVVVGPFDKVALLKEDCGITQDLVRANRGAI